MRQLIDRLGYVPRTCVWELTRACNLACQHCGSSAGHRRSDELGTDECRQLARDLGALGTERLTLSGGEPTLRSDWVAIAQEARGQGITVNLVTNGQTDAQALVRDARQAGLANVAVSLDGLRETHDQLRAPGSFERATRVIAELALAGIWVDVMLTVNRRNLFEVPQMHELAARLGARGLRAQLGKPMGRQTGRADLTLAPRHLLVLLPTLAELARQDGPVVRIGDSLGFFSPAERVLRGRHCAQGHWTGCYAGCQAIGLQSDGSVKGCLSLQPRAGEPDPFVEGNVRERPLREIWTRPGAFSFNREFRRSDLTGKCASCSHAELCRGGAKCVAYSYTGALGCDPMCYLAVATARRDRQPGIWPASAATAAAAALMALGAAGCGGEVETGGGAGGASSTGSGGAAGATGVGGQGASGGSVLDAGSDADAGFDCSSVCCYCEYGVPPPPDVFQACCCENVCCECDYGDQPPPGCC